MIATESSELRLLREWTATDSEAELLSGACLLTLVSHSRKWLLPTEHVWLVSRLSLPFNATQEDRIVVCHSDEGSIERAVGC